MKPFRFRAAPVLDLRRRQEDEARVAFAKAEAIERNADERVQAAAVREAGELVKYRDVQQTTSPAWLIGWHRSWIRKQRLELEERRRELAVAAAGTAKASEALRLAHRRRRVLERLRDRAWRKYQLEATREELREMNLLAGLRYTAQAFEAEGALNEHERDR